ncbi:hypothetical protein Tel_04535 [Candidatus Tenderia electrophaga]|jgi:hypothetical protein|uniref:Cytoplasmic protein n=1 Tax=Candidatus Tenderia electrophaga TaxID=1748243 RepID=A0A0S2TBD8_9GAMM|nr:hypothetical protein Tel_04535 [Candidatus Tenderia electrophaga]
MNQETQSASFDGDNLYREENFTDRTVGSIRRMTPVTKDGAEDSSRSVIYVGQTQVMTQVGALPLTFEIEADSLEAAIAGFSAGAQQAFEETMKELDEMRREQASSIVVPGGGGGAGGVPGGGLPGGGKIQI